MNLQEQFRLNNSIIDVKRWINERIIYILTIDNKKENGKLDKLNELMDEYIKLNEKTKTLELLAELRELDNKIFDLMF